jgi:malonyl-CoA O-methyltransferase
MTQYFITGTDTGVGKTIVSAVLTFALQSHYWKPIQSGIADETPDTEQVQHLASLNNQSIIPSTYTLQASLSPDQAAQQEGVTIDLLKCQLPTTMQSLIVEGAGGVFVPLNDQYCMMDLMKQLNLPVIIVSRGTLGTINHTLLTIAMLRQRHIPIQGVIFNGELNPDNQRAIEKWGEVKTLLHVPHFESLSRHDFQAWVLKKKSLILEALQCH